MISSSVCVVSSAVSFWLCMCAASGCVWKGGLLFWAGDVGCAGLHGEGSCLYVWMELSSVFEGCTRSMRKYVLVRSSVDNGLCSCYYEEDGMSVRRHPRPRSAGCVPHCCDCSSCTYCGRRCMREDLAQCRVEEGESMKEYETSAHFDENGFHLYTMLNNRHQKIGVHCEWCHK